MGKFCIKINNKDMVTRDAARGENEVNLVYSNHYEEGDYIVIETSEKNIFVWLQIDDALGKSMVYLTGNTTYRIPFGESRINLSPKAFYGEKHLLSIRAVQEFEVKAYRNLAINVNDQHLMEHCYPHVAANVETRGESVFAAQNAIDGVTANGSHGEWPYESWGINMQEDAKIKLFFGREVEVDRIILYTRADFPHDNWWKQVCFSFSDGSRIIMEMEKSEMPHEKIFETKRIEWLEMCEMIKSEDSSPFPALSQIEVYGTERKYNKS